VAVLQEWLARSVLRLVILRLGCRRRSRNWRRELNRELGVVLRLKPRLELVNSRLKPKPRELKEVLELDPRLRKVVV
jgi:hypothetical protein